MYCSRVACIAPRSDASIESRIALISGRSPGGTLSWGKIAESLTEEIQRRIGTDALLGETSYPEVIGQKSYKRGCQVKNTSPCRNARNIFRHPAPSP